MKIGIIGLGYVGKSTASVLSKEHHLLIYDKYKEEYKNPSILEKSEAIFICVPTPMKPDGDTDLSAIFDCLNLLKSLFINREKPLVIIRSTTPPQTTDTLEEHYDFNFVYNPEFLREKYALHDTENTDRIVIGASRTEDGRKTEEIYKPIFPNARYIHTDRKTAEMIKFSANAMLSGQIALANEIYQICRLYGVDYNQVKDTILLDPRIARNIYVPGHDEDFGFGGKCLPKDLKSLIFSSNKQGYKPLLLEEVWNLNMRVRKNKDWLEIVGATSENNFKDE